MRYGRSSLILIAGAAVLLLALPAFADTYTIFSQPTDGVYLPSTVNYGGGDGSGGTITALPPFSFSSGMVELSVPGGWSTWNCPPATESCTPNVLYSNGQSALFIGLSGTYNTAGFELEPDLFAVETVSVQFFDQNGNIIADIDRDVNGSGGALLFALQDDTPGKWISGISIVNIAGDDFAIGQLRAGNSIPEPGTMLMLGTGLLGALGVLRRKMNL
jgi:PEP-CTERM motif